jgi:hypothetical protein
MIRRAFPPGPGNVSLSRGVGRARGGRVISKPRHFFKITPIFENFDVFFVFFVMPGIVSKFSSLSRSPFPDDAQDPTPQLPVASKNPLARVVRDDFTNILHIFYGFLTFVPVSLVFFRPSRSRSPSNATIPVSGPGKSGF